MAGRLLCCHYRVAAFRPFQLPSSHAPPGGERALDTPAGCVVPPESGPWARDHVHM